MSVGQWHTHRCFRDLPCRHVSAQKIRAHLGRLGLPYLTLCPYDPIAPHFPVGPSVQGPGQTSRCGIPPDIQTTTHSLSLALSGSIQGGCWCCWWVGVLLLGGDRVSVYCVEGHRFNLIMPEGPCATPTKLYHAAALVIFLSSAALKNSGVANNIVHPRQNRLSVAVHKGLTLISGVNIDCGGKHCL